MKRKLAYLSLVLSSLCWASMAGRMLSSLPISKRGRIVSRFGKWLGKGERPTLVEQGHGYVSSVSSLGLWAEEGECDPSFWRPTSSEGVQVPAAQLHLLRLQGPPRVPLYLIPFLATTHTFAEFALPCPSSWTPELFPERATVCSSSPLHSTPKTSLQHTSLLASIEGKQRTAKQ